MRFLFLMFLFNLLFADIKILNLEQNYTKTKLSFVFDKPQNFFEVAIKDNNKTINSKVNKKVANVAIVLVDTSLSMKKYFVNIKSVIKKIIEKLDSNTKIAIAGFDNDIKIIKNFDENFLYEELDNLSPKGKVTELYKSSINAINLLKNQNILRKVLIIISDGGFEDTAYSVNDLIDKAKKNNVIILSLGYGNSVKLQSIERPAIESGGRLWIKKEKFLKEFLSYFKNGADVIFENNFEATKDGMKKLLLVVKTDNNEFKKDFFVKVDKIDNENKNYIYVILILVILIVLIILIFYKRKTQKQNNIKLATPKPIAFLIDSAGKKYPIIKNNISIGRNKENDIVIEGSFISNFHADILLKDNQFFIIDKNSTNGVGVNSEPSTKKSTQSKIDDGDEIYLGPMKFKFKIQKG